MFILITSFSHASDFRQLFNQDLSNASYDEGVWTRDAERVITASKDQIIWSEALRAP